MSRRIVRRRVVPVDELSIVDELSVDELSIDEQSVDELSRHLQGIGITNWVLAYESIPMRLRAYTMMVFGLWWAFGYCMVGPMAALLPNWRWLVIVASAPSLVVGILYYL